MYAIEYWRGNIFCEHRIMSSTFKPWHQHLEKGLERKKTTCYGKSFYMHSWKGMYILKVYFRVWKPCTIATTDKQVIGISRLYLVKCSVKVEWRRRDCPRHIWRKVLAFYNAHGELGESFEAKNSLSAVSVRDSWNASMSFYLVKPDGRYDSIGGASTYLSVHFHGLPTNTK